MTRQSGYCISIVCEKLSVRRMSILLREGERLCVTAARNGGDYDIIGMLHPVGEPIAGLVVRTGKPILVTDIRSDGQFQERRERPYATTSFTCVPIVNAGQALGAICVTDKVSGQPFNQRDTELLSTIASQVAPAIHHAQLNLSLEQHTFSVLCALVVAIVWATGRPKPETSPPRSPRRPQLAGTGSALPPSRAGQRIL